MKRVRLAPQHSYLTPGCSMTRETKIGLLVGLAFIIVIGILLSDHMSSTNEPVSAPVAKAGDSVREGVATPAGPGPIAGAPATGRGTAFAPGDPRELVLRHPDELMPLGSDNTGRGAARPTAGPTAPRTYTAESGDSVSRIAAKFYGTSTKAT